eukprot:2239754-Pyramimonas_sp.AAC.1
MGPRSAVLGTPTGAIGGALYGATKRCTGCGGRMCYPPLGPSVELAPDGATKRCTGCGGRMWYPRLGPS